MKQQLTVIKIGGNVIDDTESLHLFLDRLSSLPGPCILVHGGGKLATSLADQLQVPQQMVDGRRITDEATLKIVTMVYAGYINKNIVALLLARGCAAIGLSGADGNLVQAHKRTGTQQDYGFAGDIDAVNVPLCSGLLQQGYTLVVAPITHDKQGQLLNTNADTIAQELAQALSGLYAVRLIYCFEKSGVLRDTEDENSRIAAMNKTTFTALKAEGLIYAGMLPKLDNAFRALDKGVERVVIGKWSDLPQLVSGQNGTTISHE